MPRSVLWTLVVSVSWSVVTVDATKFNCPTITPYFFPCSCESGGENGLFLRCENTNLASLAVGLANVRFPIEELRLYKCHIKKLYGDVFKYLLLHKLVLEETPVSELEASVFQPVADTLTGLHFLNAPLQAIPKTALEPLKK
ncbi:hypothetical protein OTU49_014731, partial [Cherax quadricarinatus]